MKKANKKARFDVITFAKLKAREKRQLSKFDAIEKMCNSLVAFDSYLQA